MPLCLWLDEESINGLLLNADIFVSTMSTQFRIDINFVTHGLAEIPTSNFDIFI
ncbi:Uncharacterized protein APZ42_009860 [Daphnia magna]|uniref:Uncharacterized protein n=1 Tax=Daphnia magna TaxID=35525 RepID=A0A0N7ZK17_9CRUS|nr:Uncharacterized protein APZ42_009860 [Daphnia magna]